MRLSVALIGLLLPTLLCGETNGVRELPIQTFFRNADLTRMRLSPDGKFLVAVAHDHGKGLLFGINLETGKRKAIIEGDIHAFSWLTDDRLLFSAGGIGLGGLFAVNRDGSKSQVLQRPFVAQPHLQNYPFQVVRALAVPADRSDCVLIERAEVYPHVRPELPHPEVWRVNYFTGKTSLEEKNPGKVVTWLTDNRGAVRAAIAVEKETVKVLYRRDKQQPWTIISQSPFGHAQMRPLGFSPEDALLYVAARGGKDTSGLYSFDPDKRQLRECLWQHPQFDLWAGIISGQTRALLGVVYHANRPQFDWFSDRFTSLQSNVDEALPNAVNFLVSSSRDETKHLFLTFSDRSPGAYYLVDSVRKEFGIIGKVAGWINPDQMGETKPIVYQSRDGLTIHGYLTLPLNSAGTNLPLIVMPHGGPWLRDTWHFEPEAQFFANRGYAVLQMNFRGSTGYGLVFYEAGNKQWGRKMQDDITDGVQWAIHQGVADRKRIAIFGASYGGYAALMGLISTPELYKCGICYVGVTDLSSLLKHRLAHLPKQFEAIDEERIGDYWGEKEDLKAVSPLHHVDQIQAPLLLAYGARDPIVDVEQGRQLAKALRKSGKRFDMIIEEHEGHGFRNETNRFNLFRKIEQFLRANL